MRRLLVGSPALFLAILLCSTRGVRSEVPASKETSTDPALVERFEKEVRPVLATRCQECHGATVQKGGLRLDSRGAMLAGGNSGPAVVPGNPGESILIDAINHGELFQMPPKSKLPPTEITTLTNWVQNGAYWGHETTAAAPPKSADGGKSGDGPSDLVKQRSGHWSFLPIKEVTPPDVSAEFAGWPRNEVDRFILAKLAEHHLRPSGEATRRALIRRLSLDLTGLPPTPAEVESFLADNTPDAYEKLVDRLLASPAYGERWAKHWLDLVRYADTFGHEFDIDIPNAHGYRDYVIRALNADLPYDRFLTEHVAGDLVERPRMNPATGLNESILGTGFYFLGEGTHSPVDVREEETRRIDNQLDVFSKTFLGLTLACARCHDHKFDPITTRDYYALAGFLKSSRHQQAFLDSPEQLDAPVARLRAMKESIRSILKEAAPALPAKLRDEVSTALDGKACDECREVASASAESATPKSGGPTHFESFRTDRFGDWFMTGNAFGDGPSRSGDFLLEWSPRDSQKTEPDWRLQPIRPGAGHSGLLGPGLQGVLRSPDFTIKQPYIHMLVSGDRGRVNIVVDRFEKIRDPIYGALTFGVNGIKPGEAKWITRDISMWKGQSAYLELADGSTVDFTVNNTRNVRGDGFIAVDEIVFSDQPAPPHPAPEAIGPVALGPVLAALKESRPELHDRLAATLIDYRELATAPPRPTYGLAITDGTPEDEFVLIRGNHKNPGGLVHRRILEVLGGHQSPKSVGGSGRLDLAKQLVDPGNPLVARVMVNRLWKHHFGVGLVKTVDDFGAMGQKPSHPELLDWLARQFVERGWSIKSMHRLLVNSSTYRMKSHPDPEAERIDPTNLYLYRMNVRRLEGEAIRDSLIAIAGGLNPSMYGPAIPVHLNEFMDGRGRPSESGPLDGDARRSIYQSVRRNFLNPMFAAFDTPAPFSTMGRRNVSNVPAQALTLLNDPLILSQARRWADRLLVEPSSSEEERLQKLYTEAFARLPTPDETKASLDFLESRTKTSPAPGSAESDEQTRRAWADLCHVLINVKEFIYVE